MTNLYAWFAFSMSQFFCTPNFFKWRVDQWAHVERSRVNGGYRICRKGGAPGVLGAFPQEILGDILAKFWQKFWQNEGQARPPPPPLWIATGWPCHVRTIPGEIRYLETLVLGYGLACSHLKKWKLWPLNLSCHFWKVVTVMNDKLMKAWLSIMYPLTLPYNM